MNSAEAVSLRVQKLQAAHDQTLPAEQPYVLRLDGVAFRNYTADMAKPFDRRFTMAMLMTTRDLMERCAARTAYTQSDEISLLFAGESTPLQIVYGGRVQKIVSVMASLAAVRFNYHMGRMEWDAEEQAGKRALIARIKDSSALFDARVFSTPDNIMAGEALYWRHAFDGRRNALNMVGSQFIPHKQMQGKGLAWLLGILQERHQLNPYERYPPSAILGTILKRKHFPHVGYNPKTGQMVPTIRARVEARTFDWSQMGEAERTEMLMARLWNSEHPASLENLKLDSYK